jgi:hypothetical protein
MFTANSEARIAERPGRMSMFDNEAALFRFEQRGGEEGIA